MARMLREPLGIWKYNTVAGEGDDLEEAEQNGRWGKGWGEGPEERVSEGK